MPPTLARYPRKHATHATHTSTPPTQALHPRHHTSTSPTQARIARHFSNLSRILLLPLPCFVLRLKLVVFILSRDFVFSTSLTFFADVFPEFVLYFRCSCRQLLVLLKFCEQLALQHLLSNIFNGIRDEIIVFFSLIPFLIN